MKKNSDLQKGMRICKGVKSFTRGIELSPKLAVSRKSRTNHKLPQCSNFSHIHLSKSRAKHVHKLIEKGRRAARNLVSASMELALAGYKPDSSRSKKGRGGRGVLILR